MTGELHLSLFYLLFSLFITHKIMYNMHDVVYTDKESTFNLTGYNQLHVV